MLSNRSDWQRLEKHRLCPYSRHVWMTGRTCWSPENRAPTHHRAYSLPLPDRSQMGESSSGDYPASPQGCRVMIKLAQSLPWFGAQPHAPVATVAFWEEVAVVVLWVASAGTAVGQITETCSKAFPLLLQQHSELHRPLLLWIMESTPLDGDFLQICLPCPTRHFCFLHVAASCCLVVSQTIKQNALAPALPSLCPTPSSREEPSSVEGSALLWDSFLWEVSVCFINNFYFMYMKFSVFDNTREKEPLLVGKKGKTVWLGPFCMFKSVPDNGLRYIGWNAGSWNAGIVRHDLYWNHCWIIFHWHLGTIFQQSTSQTLALVSAFSVLPLV